MVSLSKVWNPYLYQSSSSLLLYDIYFAIQKNFVRDGTKLWDTMQEDDKAMQKNL